MQIQKNSKHYKIAGHFLIMLPVIFALINAISPHLFWEHRVVVSYPMHSTVETAGALAAIFMGFFIDQWVDRERAPQALFIALGFLSMGTLDMFHSVLSEGHGFVLLHSLALLAGGIFYSLVWLPASKKIVKQGFRLKLRILFVSICVGVAVTTFRSSLPTMIIDGHFSMMAKAINFTAGALFLLGAVRVYRNYLTGGYLECLLLTMVGVLSGTSGLIFQYSGAWTDGWWFWHGLRLTGYLLVLFFIVYRFFVILRESRLAFNLLEKKHQETLALFDGIDDVVYVSDPDSYELLYVNDRFQELWGRDVLGQKCYKVIQNMDAPCPFCTNDIIIKEKPGESYVWEFENKVAGSWFRCSDKAIQWHNEKLVRFEMAADITRQKQDQQALEQEKNFSDTLIDSLPGVFYMFDKEGRFYRWNHNFESVTGYTGGELASMTPFDLFTGEDLKVIQNRISRVFETGNATAEAFFTTKSGDRVPFLLSGRLIEHEDAPYLMGMGIDITDRKAFEQELKNSEEKFRTLIRLAPIPLCFVNNEGMLAYINDRFEQLIGYSTDEVPDLDTWWRTAYPDPEYRKWVNKTWADAVLNAEKKQTDITPIEYNVTCKNGEVRIFEVGGILLQDGFLATFVDVTERHAAENELLTINAELKRSNQDLQQFAYVASHDLQEPLRMVSSYTQLLADRYRDQLDEKAEKFIFYAVDGAVRMQKLIQDLLTFSRINTHGHSFSVVDLNILLEQVVGDLNAALMETGGQVTHDRLPEVMGDQSQLGQVLQNLVGNGLKFNKTETPKVHVSVQKNDGHWRFSVKDNGIGIDPRHHEKVFVIFQRLHTRAAYPGTGIGLALCKQIVIRHRGEIWFESVPDQGTTFYFTLPEIQK